MKKSILLLSVFVILVGCSPSPEAIGQALSMTQTALPTQTPYPTYTPQPTIVKIVIQTPKPDYLSSDCKPITNMIYGDLYKEINILKSYVETLPDVKVTTYELPEQLYSNTKSHLVFIDYISKEDGKTYAKRYIIYENEFGWKNSIFSLDGQCWIDPPN
ncbi:MAG TPA: hypothetical protein PKK09_04350 [Anaerolineaceae bacterium]|jgi:hypothetical protein|nr:hypothetical protein [Anaerolineaceae bacterium]HNW14183.1 hypothetical protein [Anaerolineaceae bacterium]HOQ68782.1 hypothetical protein [Anaerolineaceae bacterium]HQM54600.1 hypothetical protein [Anaerolineaceae bacterium]